MAKAKAESPKALPTASLNAIYEELSLKVDKEDDFFPSGSIILDTVLSNGKGIPMGCFIEIASDQGIGKSSMMLHIARTACEQGHRVIYIDTERGLNKPQLDSFGITPYMNQRLFIPAKLTTFEEVDVFFNQIVHDPLVKFVILDSITATLPQKLLDQSLEESRDVGLHARTMSMFLQKFKSKFEDANKTLFMVNQTRTKISFIRTSVEPAGGMALKFFTDIRLQMRQVAKLQKTQPGYDKPIPYGSDILIWSNKNRYCSPFIPLPIAVYFGKGIANSEAVFRALELKNKLVKRGASYKIDFEGEEKSFRGKPAAVQFVKDNLAYYKDLVDSFGGITLLSSDAEIDGSSAPATIILEDDEDELYEGYSIEEGNNAKGVYKYDLGDEEEDDDK